MSLPLSQAAIAASAAATSAAAAASSAPYDLLVIKRALVACRTQCGDRRSLTNV